MKQEQNKMSLQSSILRNVTKQLKTKRNTGYYPYYESHTLESAMPIDMDFTKVKDVDFIHDSAESGRTKRYNDYYVLWFDKKGKFLGTTRDKTELVYALFSGITSSLDLKDRCEFIYALPRTKINEYKEIRRKKKNKRYKSQDGMIPTPPQTNFWGETSYHNDILNTQRKRYKEIAYRKNYDKEKVLNLIDQLEERARNLFGMHLEFDAETMLNSDTDLDRHNVYEISNTLETRRQLIKSLKNFENDKSFYNLEHTFDNIKVAKSLLK